MEIICNSGVNGDFTVLLIIPCVRNSGVKEIHSSVKAIFGSEYEYEYDYDTLI